MEDRLLTWSTSTSESLEPMIPSRIMPTYSLLVFEMMIFRNSIQSGTEFCCPWRKIPPDDILEGLYKLRIRESEKLKTVLEFVWPGDSSEENRTWFSKDWKLWWKRSIEQDLRNKNFGIGNGKFWEERRGQESGDKTAWTKNSRRFSAVESQRAVF